MMAGLRGIDESMAKRKRGGDYPASQQEAEEFMAWLRARGCNPEVMSERVLAFAFVGWRAARTSRLPAGAPCANRSGGKGVMLGSGGPGEVTTGPPGPPRHEVVGRIPGESGCQDRLVRGRA
jgi:hypothetical protein